MSIQQRQDIEAVIRAHPLSADMPIPDLRAAFDAALAHRELPTTVTAAEGLLGQRRIAVVTPNDATLARSLLYLHGGGYIAGSSTTGRFLTALIAQRIGAIGYALDYRLAPEHPHPAALDDAVAAYRALLDLGIEGRHVVRARTSRI